jgi:hypothetical protein
MDRILSSSRFQISKPLPRFRSESPEIAHRRSGRFQLERQFRRAITFAPCVVGGIHGYRCFRLVEIFALALSIRWIDLRFAINWRISPHLLRMSSSLVSPPPLLCIEILCFSLSPTQSLPLFSLPSPFLGTPSPSVTPTRVASGDGQATPRARPHPSLGRAPYTWPPSASPSMHGERRGGGRKEMTILRIGPEVF